MGAVGKIGVRAASILLNRAVRKGNNPWDIARSRISDKFKFFRAAQINLGRLIRTGPDHVIRFGSVTAGSANFVV